ncbi:MAG TPA: ABC transporter permease [Vicinamibacterales bacterium]
MIASRRVAAGLAALFRRARGERELDAELGAFLQEAIDDNMRAGMSREAAVRAARLRLGSTAAVKENVRDAGWESLVDAAWLDVRYALRSLRKSPGFAAAATLTLALGIGATTAIFSLLDAVLLRSLPVENPEELVLVGGPQYPVFKAYKQRTHIFADLLATSGVTPLDVEVQSGVRERTAVSLVSGSYFSTLGVRASIGRVFTASEDVAAGQHPIAVVSDAYWRREFGGDPFVVNRIVRVSGTPITIVGVAPRGFFGEHVGRAPDLWIPLTMWGHIVPGRNLLESPGTGWLRLIGRVQPGVPTSGAQPELTQVFRRTLEEIFGPNVSADTRRDIAGAAIGFEPAARGVSALRAQFARPLQLLMGAVVLVLLIACANIANLLLARAAARRREIDVRLALGIGRARLVRQLLTESLVLAAIGGTFGIAVAFAGRDALLRFISEDGSRLAVAAPADARLFAFVAIVSLATAILFGLAPAWQSARTRIAGSLASRHESGAPHRHRLSSLLVVAQVAISLVLLMGAGLFLRTIANLRDVDLGFDPERLLIVDVNPQAAGYQGERAIALHRKLIERIASLPNVSSVSFAENGVLSGRDSSTNLMRPVGFLEGKDGFPRSQWDVVGPRYFSTSGVALVSGRDFTEDDVAGSAPVVAIDERMSRVFFQGADPIGRHLVWGVGGPELEIVAVVRDVKQSGPKTEAQSRFYLPYYQLTRVRPSWVLASTLFFVRTAARPVAFAPELRRVIQSEDPRLSIARLEIGPELVSRTLVQERMVAVLLVTFGALAAGLACLGLYGLIAYDVARRTNEIGIRMALGARPGQVRALMLRRALVWISAGVGAGVPLALSTSRVAQNLLFGLSPTDTATLVVAAIVISAMGLIAAYIPARRASRVDPLIALRVG